MQLCATKSPTHVASRSLFMFEQWTFVRALAFSRGFARPMRGYGLSWMDPHTRFVGHDQF
jgi:hypothetical protein